MICSLFHDRYSILEVEESITEETLQNVELEINISVYNPISKFIADNWSVANIKNIQSNGCQLIKNQFLNFQVMSKIFSTILNKQNTL